MSFSWELVVNEFDSLAESSHWSKNKDKEYRKRYRQGTKTMVSLYGSKTDDPQTIEVALGAKALAQCTLRDVEEVNFWIHGLQSSVGKYAKPKSKYKFHRIAISSEKETQNLINAIRVFLQDSERSGISEILRPEDVKVLRDIWSRRGQAGFRETLLKLYENRCAITGCETVAALEAAHVVPYSQGHHYEAKRGILLRADVHTLFDLALISIDPSTRTVVVAPGAQCDYGHLDGVKISDPKEPWAMLDLEDIQMHFRRWTQDREAEQAATSVDVGDE